MRELPFQTFERIFSIKWPGGKSKLVTFLVEALEIAEIPGSASCNLALQFQLLYYERWRTILK